jgi:hypothetical protein
MKLSIGMATYDDYDGVYFSIMALRLFHKEIAGDAEIIIVDNNPEGPCAAALKNIETWSGGSRYVPFGRQKGTAARDAIFRESSADFVLCMDSHVMFPPGVLRQLIDYISANPDTPDLLQGPLLYDNLLTFSTHMDPTWSAGMFGVWATDNRAQDPAAPPFEIGMQGLGVFACRRSAWPGFNPRLSGFGGEEGYIQEKFRRAGGRTLCLPFLRWIHRFERPMGVPYKNTWQDRIRNYLIIADELGSDPTKALDHFREHLGSAAVEAIAQAVRAELSSPFQFFDAIYCICAASETGRRSEISAQFARVGLARRLWLFDAVATAPNPDAGRALSHRAVVAEARRLGLATVLVLEDDVLFASDAIAALKKGLQELRGREWKILSLGECVRRRDDPPGEGDQRVIEADSAFGRHAVAFHRSVYDRILDEVPADPAEMEEWLKTHHDIDRYYASSLTEGHYCLPGLIGTQANIEAAETGTSQKL